MFIILCCPKSTTAPVSLFYNSEASAKIAHTNIHKFQKDAVASPVLVAEDDFGHIFTITQENLSHAVYIDHEKAARLGPPPGVQAGAAAAMRSRSNPVSSVPPLIMPGSEGVIV